jgi:D-alanine-D-alanine ligase
MVNKKRCVGILFGGRSGEHEVSLASARSIMQAIDKGKYQVVAIGIDKSGQWIVGGDPMKALTSGLASESSPVALLADPTRRGLMRLQEQDQTITSVRLAKLDIIFPVLHGTYGEDGTVQGLLELAGIPYVGCGVLASATAMDKATAKDIFRAHGLPVLPYLAIKRKAWREKPAAVIDEIEAQLAYPIFVKPANLGSSVGITKAHNRDELSPALDTAARYDRKLVIEQGIEAREIEVSVLGNDDPIASIPGEIVPCREFYDYRAKYIEDSELLIPAPLDPETAQQVRQMAVVAFKALDGAGMARADFLLDKETAKLWINELNTIPGFTEISMYPKLWEASGIPYPELIDRLIELAIERFEDKNQSETSYTVDCEG